MLFTCVFWYYVTIKNLTCYRMVQFAQICFHKNWIDNQWQQILWRDESISYFCVVGKIFKNVMRTLKRKYAVQSPGKTL